MDLVAKRVDEALQAAPKFLVLALFKVAIDYAGETVAALVAIAKANPSDYAPADLILSEISESLAEAA